MNIALVSSKGGHLGQMKIIFDQSVIGKNNLILITESEKGKSFKKNQFLGKYDTFFFDKDNLGINPFNYISTTLSLMKIFRKNKINFVFTNGAQISIPAVLACKFLGIKSLFIDTVIRVKMPNWSARACYFLVDYFLVQHKNMEKRYGKKAVFRGGIV